MPALLIATYRHTEIDRYHPLRQVLGELTTASRLRLHPLSLGSVTRLAEPYDVDPVELYNRTGGNPFFVTEVLAAGHENIPETVRDAVLARVARLTLPERVLVEAVAVVPPQAEVALLEALAPQALPALEACVASGMLTMLAGAVSFRHELARLAVEEAIPPDRALALHRAALAFLAEPAGEARSCSS